MAQLSLFKAERERDKARKDARDAERAAKRAAKKLELARSKEKKAVERHERVKVAAHTRRYPKRKR
jgi:hypothetical protein